MEFDYFKIVTDFYNFAYIYINLSIFDFYEIFRK